jgi:integrase
MFKNRRELVLNDSKANAGRVFDQLDVEEATRSDYKSRINMFLGFVGETGFNRNSYLSFKRNLADRTDLTVSTKNKYLASARVFLKELNRQGMLPADITQNIKGFSQNKKHKRDGLNDEEMMRLSEKMNRLSDNPENTRLKAILSLLTLQGLRQIEITRLDVSDIDLVGKKAFVRGKGSDDKEPIDLHPKTVNALGSYLKTSKIRSGALFQSNSNNSQNKRLTTRGLRLIVKEILNELGIEKTVHGFRHYFTTTLIKNYKGDLLEVATYTRHKGLEMLQVYNDAIKREADLPRYYNAFSGVSF